MEVGSSGSGTSRVVRQGGSWLLFVDPTGHSGARDATGAGEATQTASFWVGVQNRLAASFGIGIGGRILAAAMPTGVTALLLFAVGSMPIAHQGLTLTVGTVKDDGSH